jgi:hypothetical protein
VAASTPASGPHTSRRSRRDTSRGTSVPRKEVVAIEQLLLAMLLLLLILVVLKQ